MRLKRLTMMAGKIEKEILDKLFITDCRKVNHSEERFWLKLPVYAHLATAARANTPQLCCVASLMPRQLAAGVLTLHSGKVLPLRILL
jgi:hypothetical protein